MKYSEDVLIDIDTYVMRVSVQYEPATEPVLLGITFDPELLVRDLEISVSIDESIQDKNVGDLILRYLHYAKIGGYHLEEEIDKHI